MNLTSVDLLMAAARQHRLTGGESIAPDCGLHQSQSPFVSACALSGTPSSEPSTPTGLDRTFASEGSAALMMAPRYFPGVVMMVVCCYAKELLVLFAARASQPFFDAAPTLLSVVSIRLPTKSFTLCTRLASSPPLLGCAGLIKVNDPAVTSANHSLIKAGCY